MDRVKVIREENESEGECIEINRRTYNILSLNLNKSKLLESIKIMPIIGRNIKHFFENISLLKQINDLAVEQKNLINSLSNVNKEKPIYRERDKSFYVDKVIKNNLKVETILNKIFEKINEELPSDFFDKFVGSKKISKEYQETFFEDNRWFEVLIRECARYVLEEISKLKKSHYRLYVNKNVYGSEDTPYEIDVILIFNNTLTIFECKSGNSRQVTRQDFIYLESKKDKINADRGIFVLYEKFRDTTQKTKKYKRNNIFLFDNIKTKGFEEFINSLKENLSDLI